jgi:molybdopterin molybdotransferase
VLSVEQATKELLRNLGALEAEETPILDSLGQVLAEDVYAGINVPQHNNSAMDGYALQALDTHGASMKRPRLLHVIETIPAGHMAKRTIIPETATRIMTGAPIPPGADAVVRFEDTDEMCRQQPSAEIGICQEVPVGSNVRLAGEDIAKGDKALSIGKLIRPSEVGVLASLGRTKVRVIRRPKVAILSTGDEINDITEPLAIGKIYNSNTYTLAALIKSYGGIPVVLGVANDNEDSLLAKINQGLDADLLLTSGGINSGDYDLVKNLLTKHGNIRFHSVRMKPGKPLAFGTIEGVNNRGIDKVIPYLGLPGNPVSCMVTCEVFVRPAILKMMGHKKDLFKPTIEATMQGAKIQSNGARTFARAVVEARDGRNFAQLTSHQKSGMLISMSLANGLVVLPENRNETRTGDKVQVMMLD